MHIVIGTAGWTIPRDAASAFAAEGSHLARYSQVFSGVEINSTFQRSHRESTFARWASSVPEDFRFSLKIPKTISHEKKLQGAKAELKAFLAQTSALGDKRGPLLLQLPPSFAYADKRAQRFFEQLRQLYQGPLAFEPRHETWFTSAVAKRMRTWNAARVVADPGTHPAPAGSNRLVYFRLHGSPRMYYSEYSQQALASYAQQLRGVNCEAWCIFDNTAYGKATPNALALKAQLG